MKLTVLLLLVALAPVYSSILCPVGYTPGYIGCYYVKEITIPDNYEPPNLICDNLDDTVAKIENDEEFEKVLKPFYDEMLGGDSELLNGFVVVKYLGDDGSLKLRYLCYRDYGPYIRESYSARDYIREHTTEVHRVTRGIEIMSLYAGILVIAGLLGRLVGMGIATWGYTIFLLILQRTGLVFIPDTITYMALAVSTILSLIIALSIYKA